MNLYLRYEIVYDLSLSPALSDLRFNTRDRVLSSTSFNTIRNNIRRSTSPIQNSGTICSFLGGDNNCGVLRLHWSDKRRCD